MEFVLSQFGLELGTFFLIGLLAEIHCVGMCGPLIAVNTPSDEDSNPGRLSWSRVGHHLAYHGTRVGAYSLAGFLFGALGAFAVRPDFLGSYLRVVRGIVGVTAGGLIGLYGLNYVFKGKSSSLDRILGTFGGRLFRGVGSLAGFNREKAYSPSAFRGTLHALLPCPILYPVFLYVLARGSVLFGFLAMVLLGLGTLPLLLVSGLFLGRDSREYSSFLLRSLGVTFVLLGYVSLSMGLNNLGMNLPVIALPFYRPY